MGMLAEIETYIASDEGGHDISIADSSRRARATGTLGQKSKIVFTSNLTTGLAFGLPGLGLFRVVKPNSLVIDEYLKQKDIKRVFLQDISEEDFNKTDEIQKVNSCYLPLTEASKKLLGI